MATRTNICRMFNLETHQCMNPNCPSYNLHVKYHTCMASCEYYIDQVTPTSCMMCRNYDIINGMCMTVDGGFIILDPGVQRYCVAFELTEPNTSYNSQDVIQKEKELKLKRRKLMVVYDKK